MMDQFFVASNGAQGRYLCIRSLTNPEWGYVLTRLE